MPNNVPTMPGDIGGFLTGANPADGRGGGGATNIPTTSLQSNPATSQAGGSASPFTYANGQQLPSALNLNGNINTLLNNAMQGQLNTTPYQLAGNNLIQSDNAQGQQARQQLLGNLSQRGLANSGLQARGLAQVSGNTAQAESQGLAGIASAQAQAQTQMQQWGVQNAIQASLAANDAQMNARKLGLEQQQIDQSPWDSLLSGLGSLFEGGLGKLFSGGGSSAPQSNAGYSSPGTGIMWQSQP
jgi:hypothetical protein